MAAAALSQTELLITLSINIIQNGKDPFLESETKKL